MRHSKLIKALIIAFTLGMFAVANAADIKAVKVKGAIPTAPEESILVRAIWSDSSETCDHRYGPSDDYKSNVAKSINQVCFR